MYDSVLILQAIHVHLPVEAFVTQLLINNCSSKLPYDSKVTMY